jgi:3-dehydroquinate synthase
VIRIDDAGYPVLIGAGLLDRIEQPNGRSFIVTDRNVAEAGWAGRVAERVASHLDPCVLEPGEENKTISALEKLLDAMLEAGIERGDTVVAVGGGLVGDVAGLAAALVKRGCRLVHVPTSLLAHADAAIGGKTGVNARQGKNLIGTFHHPAAVIVDVMTLSTLPARELRAGYAEIVKYGLIGDAAFFDWCEGHGADVLAGDEAARLYAIEKSVRAKIAYVAGDERDLAGRRALLNFGHSFGHAIESESRLPHGEAVAIGMAMALRLSAELGHCREAEAVRVEAHLRSVGLPTRPDGLDPQALAARMVQDKKRQDGRPRLVLVRGIGEAFLADDVSARQLADFLRRESAGLPIL